MGKNIGVATDLPPYIINGDFNQQQKWLQYFVQVQTSWFNNNGFYQPNLTAAQVAALSALLNPPALGSHWLNVSTGKMQFIDQTGTVRTVTST